MRAEQWSSQTDSQNSMARVQVQAPMERVVDVSTEVEPVKAQVSEAEQTPRPTVQLAIQSPSSLGVATGAT